MIQQERWMGMSLAKMYKDVTVAIIFVETILACWLLIDMATYSPNRLNAADSFVFRPNATNIDGDPLTDE